MYICVTSDVIVLECTEIAILVGSIFAHDTVRDIYSL